MKTIGLIADTHGLLRPEALTALAGCELILHAGDIGHPRILEALGQLAPLHAVRGNNDTQDWAAELPEHLRLEIGPHRLYLLHDLKDLNIDPAREGIDLVLSGHSHKPLIDTRGGVLYCNPGSAGPRRFKLPISLGLLHLEEGDLRAELIELKV
ncbi:MAG: metallophosphoesterase family protein [Pseudomonas sp.]|uniref:metallophosphoesterase family protein n=1 Tax=Pseudomonas sp. TaxID=306 RepID=UPI003395D350